MSMRYDANMPSQSYDQADYEALRRSNIPVTLAESPALRFDSAEDAAVFFARELDYIKTKTYDRLYPEFTALRLFPVTHEVNEGAETVTYYSYDKTGMAKIISNYATDLPRVDVKGEPTTVPVKSIGDSYGYSVQEMRASRMAGKSLDVRKAETARYQIDRLTNIIAWAGDKEAKLPGVLDENNDIPVFTIQAGASGKTTWADKDADEVLADASAILQQVNKLTMNVEHPNVMALPSDTYIALATKRIPTTNTTVLKFLQENLPGIDEIVSCAELNSNAVDTNPYADDEDGKGVCLFYTKDEEKLAIEIPMPFYQHPLQYEKLETIVPCESRVVGAMIYYPLSAIIAVGV